MPVEATAPDGTKYTDYLSDQPESMKNEKRALLAMMAEHGTEGQAEYIKAQQAAQEARRSSIELAAARGQAIHAPTALGAELTQDYDKVMGGLMNNRTDALMGHGREMDRIGAANAAYLDQVAGAAKIAGAQLGGGIGGGGGRGGGGGGGGRGGGGSGSDYAATEEVKKQDLTIEEAAQLGGARGGDLTAPSSAMTLFGYAQAEGGPNGYPEAQEILLETEKLLEMGMDPAQVQQRMGEMLLDSDLDVWQRDTVATTIHNYLGAFGPAVTLGTYDDRADPRRNPYTEQGKEKQLADQQTLGQAQAEGRKKQYDAQQDKKLIAAAVAQRLRTEAAKNAKDQAAMNERLVIPRGTASITAEQTAAIARQEAARLAQQRAYWASKAPKIKADTKASETRAARERRLLMAATAAARKPKKKK